MISSVRSNPTTGRFTQEGGKAASAQLKALDAKIKTAKAAVSDQAKIMRQARFTPDGYKKALATLRSLQKTEKKLETERAKLIDVMTHA